jgi:cell wall-associated NlpC family hydrolase
LKEELLFRFSRAVPLTVILAAAVAGPALADTSASLHRVVRGETVQSIAQREHVSVEQLTRLNQLQGTSVAPGTLLALEEGTPAAAPAQDFNLVSPDVRTELRDVQADRDASSAADFKMWLGETGRTKQVGAMRRFARGIVNRTSSIAASLTRDAMRFIGTPYVFGGTTSSGFDCSGYVQHVFAMLGLRLPRTADAQFYAGRSIGNGIAVGDLVFFQTYEPGPSHVGIYMGSGRFIHSSSHGVMVSRLADSYWASRYLGAKRYVAKN